MTQDEVIQRCHAIRAEVATTYPSIKNVPFLISRRLKASAGKAWAGGYWKRRIEIAAIYFVGRSDNDGMLDSTIRHELAHVIAFDVFKGDQGHNSNWRAIAIAIGDSGDRCHTMKVGDEINGKCHKCGHGWECREKRLRKAEGMGRLLRCRKCKTRMPFPWNGSPKRMLTQSGLPSSI